MSTSSLASTAPPRAPGPGPRESLGSAADRPRRHLHGRPGLLHRQRRAAVHAGPAARLQTARSSGSSPATASPRRCLLITAGRLGDRHGRRRMFALGLALFTLSSAACGLAASPGMLVGARLVQGGAAALLMPNVLSLIGVLYDGVDRARALAAYGMTMGLAAVSGQLIGGVLVQADIAGLGWRTRVPHQRPGRRRRPGPGSARHPRVAGAGPGPGRPAIGTAAGHRRPDGDRAAAGRRPHARLAAVDVAVAGRRPGDPGRCSPSSSALATGRHAADPR